MSISDLTYKTSVKTKTLEKFSMLEKNKFPLVTVAQAGIDLSSALVSIFNKTPLPPGEIRYCTLKLIKFVSLFLPLKHIVTNLIFASEINRNEL